MFGFSLDKGAVSPEIITTIEDVKNLEGVKIGYRQIRLINVENPLKLKLELENIIDPFDNQGYINFLDHKNSIVAGTFISNIRILNLEKKNISLSGYVWHQPKGYYKAWKMQVNGEINHINVWKIFQKDELQGWLVFALNNQKPNLIKENINIEINGNDFHNLDEFFCVLGEEINGVAGYFGRNIPALYDCLRDGFGVHSIKELTWKNHARSKQLFKTKFIEMITIFQEFNIIINLE